MIKRKCSVLIFLYLGTATLSKWSEYFFKHCCQLTTPEKIYRSTEGRSKKFVDGKSMREKFLFPPLGAIPWANARLCVRAPWAECEDTDGAKTQFGTKRKHFPAPLHWRSAQSLLAFACFSRHLHFEAARTFSPHECLTGKSRHVPPNWVTTQVNLINAITELAIES